MYDVDWTDAERAFYHFMRDGWVSGKPQHQEILALDGYRVFAPPPNERYKLIDMWTRTPLSDYSTGVTTLYQRFDIVWIPIWTMHYGGMYRRDASDVVQSVLRNAYHNPEQHGFCGCRGPRQYSFAESYVYNNDFTFPETLENPFKLFNGREKVVNFRQTGIRGGVEVGYHEYFGKALL